MAVALRERRPIRGIEGIAERSDGNRVAFLRYPTPLYGAPGRCIGGINALIDITQRVGTEKRQAPLAQEVDHHAKKLRVVVSSLLLMTKADDAAGYAAVLNRRIRARAKAHTLLAMDHRQRADIRPVLRAGDRILRPPGNPVGPPG